MSHLNQDSRQLFNAIPEGLTQGVPFADYVAVVAFTYFGFKTLYDASQLVSKLCYLFNIYENKNAIYC